MYDLLAYAKYKLVPQVSKGRAAVAARYSDHCSELAYFQSLRGIGGQAAREALPKG